MDFPVCIVGKNEMKGNIIKWTWDDLEIHLYSLRNKKVDILRISDITGTEHSAKILFQLLANSKYLSYRMCPLKYLGILLALRDDYYDYDY